MFVERKDDDGKISVDKIITERVQRTPSILNYTGRVVLIVHVATTATVANNDHSYVNFQNGAQAH